MRNRVQIQKIHTENDHGFYTVFGFVQEPFGKPKEYITSYHITFSNSNLQKNNSLSLGTYIQVPIYWTWKILRSCEVSSVLIKDSQLSGLSFLAL